MRLIFLLLFLVACSPGQMRRKRTDNARATTITRQSDEKRYPLPTPVLHKRAPYPWEHTIAPLTLEHFRCHGNPLNPPLQRGDVYHADCNGAHSLPIREEQEFIYPPILPLLNHLQDTLQTPVTITSGHRCPTHNTYLDPENASSKHQIGAEVTFLIPHLPPETILEALFLYFDPRGEEAFSRWDPEKTNVSTPPWYNKYVFIKLFLPDEGRDLDNSHPHPYIAIQVRRDPTTNQPVSYSWPEAQRRFWRY